MGLFGALSSGVSGLNAQSTAIATISDNVSNINTVGYKGRASNFGTLVTSSISTTSYASGGVKAGSRTTVDGQGLIQGTGVVTDLAISGEGLFVVNTRQDASGDTLYTRSGSFRKDNRGNFVNGAGFYLMAWPLDPEGRLPGDIGNINTTSNALLESLEPVNIRSLSGVAAATTKVDVGLNLDAGQALLQGAGDSADFETGATYNRKIGADDIIAPSGNLRVGDALTVTAAGVSYSYNYGGFVTSNDISTGILGAFTPTQLFSGLTAGDKFTITTPKAGTVTFTYTPSSPNTLQGQFNDLSSLATAIDDTVGLTARVVNNQLLVAPEDATESMSFKDVTGGMVNRLGFTGSSTDLTTTPVLGATSPTSEFTGAVDNVDKFTITTSAGTVTLTYRTAATPPNPALGEFSNLTELAAAINNAAVGPTIGVQAAIVNGKLQVTTTSPAAAPTLTFADTTGTFVSGLGLGANGISAGLNRFNTMAGLSNLINNSDGISAVVENPLDDSSMKIYTDDPLGIINFSSPIIGGQSLNAVTDLGLAGTATTLGLPANDGDAINIVVSGTTYTFTYRNPGVPNASLGEFSSMDDLAVAINSIAPTELTATINPTTNSISIAAIGDKVITSISDVDNGGGGTFATLMGLNAVASDFMTEMGIGKGPFGPAYDPSGTAAPNMASGKIVPQFSRNVRMFDAQGTGHDFQMSYAKLADNTWAVEVYAIDPKDIVSNRTDGLVASGTVRFNGDGSLRSVDASLTQPLSIAWTNGASPNSTVFNFGTAGSPIGTVGATTIGLTDGLRQFDATYNVEFVDQNGVAAGLLTSVVIDEDGFVVANFSNGESRKIYKVPLADFANPNGLQEVAGNAYRETQASGNFNLREPGTGGVGKISPASLESANVEIADELTRMIVAQRGYQASSKVISTVDSLLDELNRIFN